QAGAPRQLDAQPQPAVQASHEHEHLAADLHDALAPGEGLVRARVGERVRAERLLLREVGLLRAAALRGHHFPVIFSGRTQASYCSAVTSPSSTAVSRSVLPLAWAALAMRAALS